MEVVEAAAAQLETLKFNGTGFRVGEGPAAASPGSAPAPGTQPPLQSHEGSSDTGQTVEVKPAGEQPLQPFLNAVPAGTPAPQPQPPAESPACGDCVTSPGAAELALAPDRLETSESESDSDRSGAYRTRSCGE
ncbi:H/ACA ribonucleoprotein complex non-core subunit naf1, partial [Saguinus oedipus]